MASRQLRKLRKQQELLSFSKGAAEGDDGSGDEPEPFVQPRKSVFSGFAALGDDGDIGGDDDDDSDEQKSDQDETKPDVSQQTGIDGQADEAFPAKKSKKSKKKKKKGKKADTASVPAQDSHDSFDEIDRALQELKLAEPRQSSSAAAHSAAASSVDQLRELLQINFQHLKAMNEMRKLFGKAIETADSEATAQENRPRGENQEVNLETYLSANARLPGRASKPAMFDSVLRTNPFIEGKKTWPRNSALGLKMTAVVPNDGVVGEYAFSHDSNYDQLESKFFQIVQMYDPMQLVRYLYQNPYHVSTLIQVSKYAKHQDQNSALSADLIERALFTLGRVSLKDFRKNLEHGQVFMDFSRPENRQFYLAGWHLIQHLILKGTFRTALEWSKLLLSINLEDPYAMINWVHVLAIRAHQAQWFVDLCKTELLDEKNGLETSVYIKQTLALAYLQLGDMPLAKATLIEGIERLPWLYDALFRALNLDSPKSIWGVEPRDEDEELHTGLYIHMTKDLWSGPQTISLLAESANAAQKAKADSLPRGPRVSLGTARFIYLENKPDLMSAVPRQMLHGSPNFDFDPLPPPKNENIFSSPTQQLQWEPASARSEGIPFLNNPRVRAAIAARAAEEGGLDLGPEAGGDEQWDEEERRHQEELLAREVADARDGAIPTDNRGFLGRVLALLGGGGGELFGGHTGMPGGWGDEDEWNDDEFEGEDDFDGEIDDDELPDLEAVPDPRHVTVEDVDDDEDEPQT